MVKTLLHRQKRLLSFQNKQLFVFNDKQSTQYHKKHSGLMNEMLWIWRLCDVAKTGDKSSLRDVFCRKTSFKSNLKLINSI